MDPSTKKLIRGILLAELVGVVGFYTIYFRLHANQDFRHTVHKKFPAILEAYYKWNEQCGIHGVREKDQIKWSNSEN
ncbi:PREDICTED: protein CEBPZOS isoform X2 [Gavialis gangeticus]|uniref:protein CEBPZOS isoform X2 n=1 Tax=Gavialis gangeticus TaxID=94835 RepID=UPI00092EBA09|nr:PREDICTED: protein CEBPZOS isoform X2 [Gavialis gangeticus]XP_019382286.1 PREDICTED: protein CEBPZOS isoform X2 [Gavialis gangeticus]